MSDIYNTTINVITKGNKIKICQETTSWLEVKIISEIKEVIRKRNAFIRLLHLLGKISLWEVEVKEEYDIFDYEQEYECEIININKVRI